MIRHSLISRAWTAVNRNNHRRFEAALAHPRAEQEQILRRYLSENAETDFGTRHGFSSINGVDDFRRRVPLSDFENYRHDIERIRHGAGHVLARDPVRRLVPSSGSAGPRKSIPYTAGLSREFNKAVGPWIVDLYRDRPGLTGGPAYWAISPSIEVPQPERATIPEGFEADAAYLGARVGRLVDTLMAVPAPVGEVAELDAFRRITLLFLLAAEDLRLISVWHPSFLSLLLDALARDWDRLLSDLGRQTPSAFSEIDPSARRALARRWTPHARRAKELSRVGPSQVRGIWPELGLISCWCDGHARPGADTLAARCGGIEIQAKGLMGTEAAISLPHSGGRPVAVRSHFFEFLDDSGRSLLLHELEDRAEYSVIVTTAGGLYRYRTGDRIAVDGFIGSTACLRFVGRSDRVSDRFGEKLHDAHVARALSQVVEPLQLGVRFAMLAPDERDGVTAYTLYLESERQAPAAVAQELHQALCDNPHYRYCWELGQLAPVRLFRIEGDGHDIAIDRAMRQGARLGDVKPVALSPEGGWSDRFSGSYFRNAEENL